MTCAPGDCRSQYHSPTASGAGGSVRGPDGGRARPDRRVKDYHARRQDPCHFAKKRAMMVFTQWRSMTRAPGDWFSKYHSPTARHTALSGVRIPLTFHPHCGRRSQITRLPRRQRHPDKVGLTPWPSMTRASGDCRSKRHGPDASHPGTKIVVGRDHDSVMVAGGTGMNAHHAASHTEAPFRSPGYGRGRPDRLIPDYHAHSRDP